VRTIAWTLGFAAAGFVGFASPVASGAPSIQASIRTSLQAPSEPTPADPAPDGGFEDELAIARGKAVEALVVFAEWCGTVKLYAERDKALLSILHFDPAHADAHRGLKHTQQRDGTWVVPEKRAESRNYNAGKLEEGAKRRAEIAREFREHGLAMLAMHAKGSNGSGALPADARQRIVADALAIDPDDVATRELAGEVRRGDEWVLKETEVSRERRAAIKDLVTRSAAAVPAPKPIEPAAHESALGVPWATCVATPTVRVLSTGAADEAHKVAIMASATEVVFRELTGAEKGIPAGFTIYLLNAPAARDAFLGAWPGWSAEERARLKTWAGAGVPGDIHHARWDADAPRRLDGAVRHVIGLLTLLNYGYDHQKCAWAWEGVGLYLTRELVGTRFTWYSTGPTTGDAESKALLGKLMMGDVNWMNECFQRAKRGKAPTAEKLCERKIDQFGVDEILTSYALAAYLFEGRPDRAGATLRAIGAQGAAKGLASGLECALPDLDARFLRWMSERK
jgi:hypothetical protein